MFFYAPASPLAFSFVKAGFYWMRPANELTISDKDTSYAARGAGDRLGRILEETKPVWMGRRKPIPGDPPRRIQADDLARLRAVLHEALSIIDRLSR